MQFAKERSDQCRGLGRLCLSRASQPAGTHRRSMWGLAPKACKWIYRTAVKRILSYSAKVWVRALYNNHALNLKKIERVQALALRIMITFQKPYILAAISKEKQLREHLGLIRLCIQDTFAFPLARFGRRPNCIQDTISSRASKSIWLNKAAVRPSARYYKGMLYTNNEWTVEMPPRGS